MSERDPYEPIHELSTEERVLWDRLVPRMARLYNLGLPGGLNPQHVLGMELLVRMMVSYLSFHRDTRRLRRELPELPNADEFEREVTESRRIVRDLAADFGLLPVDREGLAPVDACGEDIELKQIFGLEIFKKGDESSGATDEG